MVALDRIQDAIKRMEIQKTWGKRLDGLGMSRAAFCDKHELNTSILSRLVNCKMAAEWVSIQKIESAMEKENI